jgi:23S rRNA (guanine745-N1)-methyltransferase
MPHNLACPLDGTPLNMSEKELFCANGHSFDIARQGYVNLFPVQHKKTRDPGDSKEMVAARSRFLESAAYLRIAEILDQVALSIIPNKVKYSVLDAGCGEGYYLEQLYRSLSQNGKEKEVSLVGLDVSKWAILAAAKRNAAVTWVVGSNKIPPLLPDSVDLIICAFGFPFFDSFKKVLRPGGRLILADAGPDHLMELRQVIYPTVKKTPPPDISPAEQLGFRLEDTQNLRYSTGVINHEQIMDLLTMTPHLYRATQAGKEAAKELEYLDLTVDVVFRTLQLLEKDEPEPESRPEPEQEKFNPWKKPAAQRKQ